MSYLPEGLDGIRLLQVANIEQLADVVVQTDALVVEVVVPLLEANGFSGDGQKSGRF